MPTPETDRLAADDLGSYSIVRLRNGACSLRAGAYAETMHPGIGPEAEAEALYVQQTNLPQRWQGHAGEFVVWDVGLGGAANALAILRAARASPSPSHLQILSFDHTDAPLRFALAHEAELPYLQPYRAPLQDLLQNRRAEVDHGRIQWTLHLDDFPTLLERPAAAAWPKPHLILFDPFSPAKNPAMWTLPLFQRLHSLLDPDRPCLMPTYSRSTLLRVTLLLAGFFVGAGRSTGCKDETTVAANRTELIEYPLGPHWLKRAYRSDSAEPLRQAIYRKEKLKPATWEQVRSHPQFQVN